MALEAKIGFLRDRLVVEGVEHPLRRERGGWTVVPGDAKGGGGRVRYDGLRDRISVKGPHGTVEVPFRLRHTTFQWQGRTYQVGPMVWGHVMIMEGERPVVTGRLTLSGVRLGYVARELEPIARELAVGFAHRSTAMWRAATVAGASH